MLNECNTAEVLLTKIDADCVRVKEMKKQMLVEKKNSTSNHVDEYHLPTSFNVPDDCDLCVLADQRIFYLYHLTKSTTYEDPRQGGSTTTTMDQENESSLLDETPEMPPLRTYEIHRHPNIGFGFVAASQHPVIIQFVTIGGPSDGKLMANDQIIEVNGLDVSGHGKDEVVNLIRGSPSPLVMTVAQLPTKKKPSKKKNYRVRFEDKVTISQNDPSEIFPIIPNVVRVFLENGQTKSFKYDQNTGVQDVLNILNEKLQIKNGNRFALALEQFICTRSPRLTLLPPDHLLSEIASQPMSQSSRCRFRLTFVPQDLREFATDDPNAFNYLYEQCVNDVVAGRFSYEMRYEACVRLAALHLRQVAIDTKSLKPDGRPSVSKMEQEYGLATFLPTILLENVKKKEIRKHLRFYLKKDDQEQVQTNCRQSMSPRNCTAIKKFSISEELPSFSICSLIGDTMDINQSLRLRYVQIVSHLPSFGGRCFSVTFKQTRLDMLIQIDANQGLLVRHPGKLTQPTISIDYDLIDFLHIAPETDILRCMTVKLRNTAQQGLEFLIDKDDVSDFVLYVTGYCQVIYGRKLHVEYSSEPNEVSIAHQAPPYEGTHFVLPAGWNYSAEMGAGIEVMANFTQGPPSYFQAMGATGNHQDHLVDLSSANTHVKTLLTTHLSNGSHKAKRASLELPRFTDDTIVGSLGDRQNHQQDSPGARRSRLLTMTESLLVKNRPLSPRFRDSIRLYKQRHSVPNGTSKSPPKTLRRLSSSDDTDCSQSPTMNKAEILVKASTPNSPVNNIPRPSLFIKRNSLTQTRIFDQHKASFGLNSPDQLPQLQNIKFENLVNNSSSFTKKHVENALSLFPDKICTDLDIIDLTNGFVDDFDERKHVRFNFVDNQAPPKPPRRSYSPPLHKVNQDTFLETTKFGHALGIEDAFSAHCPVVSSHIPTSKTFPMGDKDLDFGEDFVPRTYAMARKEWDAQGSDAKPQIRRMSLKEFSGLEPSNSRSKISMSPILARFHRTSISTTGGSHLLDKFCLRRRSSSGLHKSPLDNMDATDHAVTNRFGIAGRSPSTGPPTRIVHEPLDFKQIEQRLKQMRSRLSSTMENVPNESPRKRNTVDTEKVKMMEELTRLAFGCKNMVRATTLPGQNEEIWRGIVMDTVDSADGVTEVAESMLKKSNSLYQAQLMSSKVDQMLRALIETIHDVEKAHGAEQYGEEAKQLVRSSTSLAASLTNLIHSVQGL
uniref:Uncharacterized protein n=1 Tax=Panagrolaimus sp. JU765 TaxID=591449 RepID=A0AC34R2Z8_9BILA